MVGRGGLSCKGCLVADCHGEGRPVYSLPRSDEKSMWRPPSYHIYAIREKKHALFALVSTSRMSLARPGFGSFRDEQRRTKEFVHVPSCILTAGGSRRPAIAPSPPLPAFGA
ncbi:unnamed protein product [Scytosiphon promiscuus]